MSAFAAEMADEGEDDIEFLDDDEIEDYEELDDFEYEEEDE
jgi:GTP-binding protein